MITIGIATLKERENSFRKTIESLYEQADEIHTVLNFYPEIPKWLLDLPKVHGWIGNNILGASGKMLMASKAEGYYLTCDDDLRYPDSYVKDMVRAIDKYHCIITLHGKRFHYPVKSYRKDFYKNIRCLDSLEEDTLVDVGGTGCMGWHTNDFKISIWDFKYPNKVDVELSREAHAQKVPIVALAHRLGYLKYMKPEGETIWQKETDDRIQTEIVNDFLK